MRILLINQFYRPDVAATGQLLGDLAEKLASDGHEAHVLCSQRAYGGGEDTYPKNEVVHGVHVHRVGACGFGRGKLLGRMVDYLSFYLLAMVRALRLPRMAVCVALTTPPFVALVPTSSSGNDLTAAATVLLAVAGVRPSFLSLPLSDTWRTLRAALAPVACCA